MHLDKHNDYGNDTYRTKKRAVGAADDKESEQKKHGCLLLSYIGRGHSQGYGTYATGQYRVVGWFDDPARYGTYAGAARRRAVYIVRPRSGVDRAEAVEIYLQAFRADYYLSSANAITEDGVIVNIDGNGNRVAAITFGPSHVIFVIGLNKVTQTVDAALARARSTAGPINTARFDISTPCKADGVCHNCNSPECICNHIHFLRNSPRRRHTVVLVGEPLGY